MPAWIFDECREEMLRNYLWDSINVRDTAVRKSRKEHFCHGMLLGLLKNRTNWLIWSNGKDKIGKLNGIKSIKY